MNCVRTGRVGTHFYSNTYFFLMKNSTGKIDNYYTGCLKVQMMLSENGGGDGL